MIQRYDFNISGKNLGLVFIPHFADNFSRKKVSPCYTLLVDKNSVSDSIYFLRYWAICVLQFFVNQVVEP